MLEKYLPEAFCKSIVMYGKDVTDITLAQNENMYLSVSGTIIDTDCFVTRELLDSIVAKMCNGSIYASQATLKQGFITLDDGCRVGTVGTVVTDSDGRVTHLRDISAINIRIARIVPGAANKIICHIRSGSKVYNTLIIAPPAAGKTTVLKDLAMQLGDMFRIGIADERGEIVQKENIGRHVFAMRGGLKHDGILAMLRSMSPQIIMTDEIGTKEDERAIFKLLNAGVKVICTAHGYDEKDILRREVFRQLVKEKAFERLIVLSGRNGPGTVEKFINTEEYDTNG